MGEIIEPIVTDSQELIVTGNYVTIGSMNTEMIEFAKRLNLIADQKQLPPKGNGRQAVMAAIFKVSQKGARKWLEAEAIPKTSRLNEIANYFGVSTEWLLSGKGEMRASPKISSETSKLECIRLPVISEVQAGAWSEAIDNFHPGDADHWIETSAKVSKKAFALRVSGDSMVNPYGYPSIPDGSYVIVDPEISPTNGRIVVAKLQDSNQAVLKKLVIDGPNKYLKALNPEYKTIQIDENCLIIGVAKRIEIDL